MQNMPATMKIIIPSQGEPAIRPIKKAKKARTKQPKDSKTKTKAKKLLNMSLKKPIFHLILGDYSTIWGYVKIKEELAPLS